MSLSYVIDASVAVKWFFPEEHSEECRKLLSTANELLVPDHLWSEVGNVIWKRFRRDEISAEEALETVTDILQMPVVEISSHGLLTLAVEIAVAVGITVYDALYLALALSRGCLLTTADQKLINQLAETSFEPTIRHVSKLAAPADSE
jgi:predicted nucleic acid-binding protein